MSTISMFGTCQTCGLIQYMQGQPCRDCGGKVQQGGLLPGSPTSVERVIALAAVDKFGTLLRGSKPLRSVELVDRAHVTRLEAEVERLATVLTDRSTHIGALDNENKALQSKLTKALELMVPAAHRLSDLGQSRLSEPMFAFVLNQSAPADPRADFERMAAIVYPGALSAGRHPVHGTYINNNLEKRWKGWKACEEFRAGILPTQQRGKS